MYQKYQITIHGDTAIKCNESQFKRFLCNSPLEVVLTCNLAETVMGMIADQEDNYNVFSIHSHNSMLKIIADFFFSY